MSLTFIEEIDKKNLEQLLKSLVHASAVNNTAYVSIIIKKIIETYDRQTVSPTDKLSVAEQH
ncbi:MAG TPA: hypothetical protein VG982_01185 [Candidatus Paceibacterota bacterium]|nr:hypothetical protein [Candidatus Paceibacterota bacterium]